MPNNVIPTGHDKYSYSSALWELLSFSSPYVLMRGSLATQWFTEGLVLKQLGHDATLAGPMISAVKGFSLGFCQGFMMCTGFLCGEQIKQGQGQAKLGRQGQAQSHFLAAGNITKFSWILAILLASTFTPLLHFSATLLDRAGMNLPMPIQTNINRYFSVYSFSLLPTLLCSSAKSFLVANKRRTAFLIFSLIQIALSVSIGYSSALLTDVGIEGMGIGTLISSSLTAFGLRYYLKKEFPHFNLFAFDYKGIRKQVFPGLRHGGALSASSLAERANITIITIFATHLGAKALALTQVSLQLILPFNFIPLAFGQAVAIRTARERGALKLAQQMCKPEQVQVHKHNIKILCDVNVILNVIIAAITALTVGCFAQYFSQLFVPHVSTMTLNVLYINCARITIDAARISYAGSMKGLKNTAFSPAVSFLFMSAIGLVVSGAVVYSKQKAPSYWLFAPTTVGIVLSTIAIAARWRCISDRTDALHNPITLKQKSVSGGIDKNHEEGDLNKELLGNKGIIAKYGSTHA